MDTSGRNNLGAERGVADVGDANRRVGESDSGSDAVVPVMTRAEAKAAGLKRYFTGKPCKHGHIAERIMSDMSCLECRNIVSATPERRAASAAWHVTSEGRTARAMRRATSKGRAAKRAETAAREATSKGRAAKAIRSTRLTARRQATRAAKILTETLGIPHTVVKMEDGTFQPVPL